MINSKMRSSPKMPKIGTKWWQGWSTLMTRFKSMSLDEQTIILEQSAQGGLRAREEMIESKEREAPQATSIQERVFLCHRMHEKGDFSCYNK